MLAAASRSADEVESALFRLREAENSHRRAAAVHASIRRKVESDHYFREIDPAALELSEAASAAGIATALCLRACILHERGRPADAGSLDEARALIAQADAVGARHGHRGRRARALARRARGYLAAATQDPASAVREWGAAAEQLRGAGLPLDAEACERLARRLKEWEEIEAGAAAAAAGRKGRQLAAGPRALAGAFEKVRERYGSKPGVLPSSALPDLAALLHSFPALAAEELAELAEQAGARGGVVTLRSLLAWWHRSEAAVMRMDAAREPQA